MILFTVPGIPKGKGRPRFARSGNRIITYTPSDTVAYENAVKAVAMQAMRGKEPIQGACEIAVTAFFPIPKSWPESKKQLAIAGKIRPTKKPDLDNILKIICDPLKGIVWRDDDQVVGDDTRKWYGTEPRVEVVIKECRL